MNKLVFSWKLLVVKQYKLSECKNSKQICIYILQICYQLFLFILFNCLFSERSEAD